MKIGNPPPILSDEELSGPVAHNHSVLKAVALIGCLIDAPEGQTLSQLARKTALNVSTAYRILRTLTATGVLFRRPGEDRYVPGPMLLALAGATFGTAGFGRILDLLRELSIETGEAASFGVRDGDCVAVLFAVPSPHGDVVGDRPGARINLHCAAMGKAILAHGDPAHLERRVQDLGALQPMTPHSLTDPAALLAAIETAHQQGFALSRNEQAIGVSTLAVAVALPSRESVAALGLLVPDARWVPGRELKLSAVLSSFANRLADFEKLSRLPFS